MAGNEAVSTFLSEQAGAKPDFAETYLELADLCDRKLWHQLTDKLEEIVRDETLQGDGSLIELYHGVVVHLESKMNPLRVAQIAVAVSAR